MNRGAEKTLTHIPVFAHFASEKITMPCPTPLPEKLAMIARTYEIMPTFLERLKRFCMLDRCPFFAGMALSLAFISRSGLLLSVLVLFAYWASCGGRLRKSTNAPAIFWAALALSFLHIGGLVSGTSPYWSNVLREIFAAAVIAGLYILGAVTEQKQTNGISQGFFALLIPLAGIAAVLGLIKATLLGHGVLLGPLYYLSPRDYPIGSSLIYDRNVFGLLLLAALVGLIVRSVEQRTFRNTFLFVWLPLVLIASAAILTGSRRIFFLIGLFPVFWLIIGLKAVPRPDALKRVYFPVALVVGATALFCWSIVCFGNVHDYLVMTEEQKEVARQMSGSFFITVDNLADLKSAPSNILAQVTESVTDGSFKAARLSRWQFSLELLRQTGWLGGEGFSYHEAFSCQYQQCASMDYPHLVFLSEWLIGGPLGLLLALAFYLLLLRAVFLNGWEGLRNGSSVLLLLVFPFSLLSGDTLFSLPQLCAAGLLVYQSVSRNEIAGQER